MNAPKNSLEAVQRANELADVCIDLEGAVDRAKEEKHEASIALRRLFVLAFAEKEPEDLSHTLRELRAARARQQSTEENFWVLQKKLEHTYEDFKSARDRAYSMFGEGAGLKNFDYEESDSQLRDEGRPV